MNAELHDPGEQRKLSFPFAKRHGVLIRGVANGVADTVCRPGVTPQSLAEVRRFVGVPLKLQRVSVESFDSMLRVAYEAGSGAAMQMLEGLDDNTDLAHLAEDIPESSDLLESDDEAPIIRLINALLTQAVKENASDIHIEPYENRLVIRFRVDGVLREVLQTKRAVAPLVVSRIKVMSKLDIAERRLPQDGRISLRIAGRAVDVRVSTLPSGHGERVVLRLLDKQAGRIELTSLGMDPRTQATMDEIIHKPHGIILVTGPTGSGKTTTLYAALERINDNTRNVMTVEDPIEYYIDGIGQTQVNTKVEMTFARGLRAILRQDPDVVMVGEIRDLETAQIAVQASLTGHLVLSTLHTNTAVGAVTRLRDMGIEPFLLSSSLIGVLAQRLVRVLNAETREPFMAGEYERRLLNLESTGSPVQLYRPSNEPGSGYRGRTGIYELIAVDDHMRTMIHDGSSEQDLERYARIGEPRHPRRRPQKGHGGRNDARRSPARHPRGLMGAFEYTALDAQGRERKGLIEGDTPKHVRQLLRDKQLLPMDIQETAQRELKKRRARGFMRRGLSTLDLALMTRQLATLLRSGLPLEESLQAVGEQTEKPRVQRIILGVRSKVVEGHPLADGLRDFPQAFPEIYRATVSAGEQSGKLDSVLERLSDYTESRQVMGQQVSNALVYPIVLMVLSFAIVSFLLAYVVPQVVAVFESGHQELPVATRILIGMSDLIRHYWIYALIVIGAGTWGFLRWLKAPRGTLEVRPFPAASAAAGKAHSRPQYGPVFAHVQHSDRQRSAGARGAADFRRGRQQPSHEEGGRGSGLARARGSAHRQVARGAQTLPPHDDSPHQQRREQRRAGKDARAGGDAIRNARWTACCRP